MQTNRIHIVLLAIFLTILCSESNAQEVPKNSKPIPSQKQTEKPKGITIENEENITIIKPDSSKKAKTYLEDKVKYKAKGYARFDQKKKTITLYDNAELYYQEYELKSGIIVFDYSKNEVYAGRLKDSLGNFYQYPVFKEGNTVIEPDSIRFNYKTKKAKVWNTKTEQGEFRIKAAVSKKENDSVYFMKGARFTTSKNIEDPEYYFLTNKVKFVPKKKVVVGFTNMWIADVPTPLALPFAFFPMTEKARSGIILPSYNYTEQRGYTLQNGGYYFALSDYYDLAVLGDYYTNGSYALRFETKYALRYKFNGTFNVNFENLIDGERGFPNYSKSTIYNIKWSHTKDGKSNPNSNFAASVNLGSSQYYRQSLNQINIGSNLNNTLQSSISYRKKFNIQPEVNLSLTANHQQNTNTSVINMTLPTLTLNMAQVFPFASDSKPKKGILQNINITYNLNGSNSFVTTDSLFFRSEMFRNGTTGFKHDIPLTTNFKVFKYFNVNSSINYSEVWYLQTIKKRTNFENNKVVDDRVNGFDSFRTYSFSNSLSTNVYGTFKFGENKKLQAIRHMITPSIAHGYTPKFDQHLEQYEVSRTYSRFTGPNTQSTFQNYTRFDGGVYGNPNLDEINSMSIGLNNLFEGKIKDRDTTKLEPKKIQLLRLNLASSYDFKLKTWAPINFNGGTSLFDQIVSINFGGVISPYEIINSSTNYITKPFTVTSAFFATDFALTSGGSDKKQKKNTQGRRNGGREDDLFGANVDLSDRRESQFNQDDEESEKPNEFYKSDIPWDFRLSFTLNYSDTNFGNKISSSSINFSGNTQLTPKWKMGITSGYDIVNKGVTFTQLRMERDLLSWRMDFSWVPFGTNTSWYFFIGIKSGVLSDIKWDRRSLPDRTLR